MSFITRALPLILLSGTHASSASNDASQLVSEIQKKLNQASGNLRRGLSKLHEGGSDIDICEFVELHFATPFRSGPPKAMCDCQGTLATTTTLNCNFEDVCDDYDVLCVDLQVNATLAGILDDAGNLGPNPKMGFSACMDMESPVPLPEPLCLSMDFSKPDFFLPNDCSFSFGGNECVCVVDKSVPCYEFDCSSVVPGIASKSCQEVDLSKVIDPMVLVPMLGDLPKDFEQSLEDYKHHKVAVAVNNADILEQAEKHAELGKN